MADGFEHPLDLAVAALVDCQLQDARPESARLRLDVVAPSRYFRVDKLPRNAMGKVQRRDLAAWVAAHGEEITSG